MRTCAKMRCGSEPVATVNLDYAHRVVSIGPLHPQRDPNLLDLCREHSGSMTPPLGWTLSDEREPVVLTG
jgi:hypothetical protein